MANTGYIINNTVRQYFTSGPNSGSAVATGSDVDLTVSPFSASLDNQFFYNRTFDPINCPEGFEVCLSPLLTGVNTGSLKGRFELSYVTQSGFNTASAITASVSNDINFSTLEIFSASIGSVVPITSSFTSGTVYFKAFTSCSGPDPSAESDLLSFTYNIIRPQTGTSNIVFRNNYSSAMKVEIRSLRGNANYNIEPGTSVTYNYTATPNPGSWTSTGKSEDLNINIKGGASNPLGNIIQRTTVGQERTAYTTGGGFDEPTNSIDESNTFAADAGISFIVRQLRLPDPGTTTTTTFTLQEAQTQITSVFGSSPFSTKESACNDLYVNFRENHYYAREGILYDNFADAQSKTRTTFPYTSTYIITSRGIYINVNQTGKIIEQGVACVYSTINLYTLQGSYPTQEEACKRIKTSPGAQTFTEIDINLRDGRYPIFDSSLGISYRGGTNAIISNRKIIAIETCGSELTSVQYSSIGYTDLYFENPILLQKVCGSINFDTYYIGPSGIVYYPPDAGTYGIGPYVPLGLGTRYYKTTNGFFVKFDRGVITDTINPCNV